MGLSRFFQREFFFCKYLLHTKHVVNKKKIIRNVTSLQNSGLYFVTLSDLFSIHGDFF